MEAEETGFDQKDGEPILILKYNAVLTLGILEKEGSEGNDQ